MHMFVNPNHQNHQLLFRCYSFEYNFHYVLLDGSLLENYLKVTWKAINRSIYRLLNNCNYLSYVAIVLDDSFACGRAPISPHLYKFVYG